MDFLETHDAQGEEFDRSNDASDKDPDYEALDPRFRVRDDHWTFFVPGRVFQMLSWEPQKAEGSLTRGGQKHGEAAFAKVYHYVVVQPKPKEGHSICLRISTYSGEGMAKILADQAKHAIIYTGDNPPDKLPDEKKIRKDPIRVMPIGDCKLEALSRINFAKEYPVEHKVKVLEIGNVAPSHLNLFLSYWQSEMVKGFPYKTLSLEVEDHGPEQLQRVRGPSKRDIGTLGKNKV